MTIETTSCKRDVHDLSHLVFDCGKVGRLQTLTVVPVIAGDSYEEDLIGSFRLSPLRRGLASDCVVDVLSFYIPHRHAYGDEWVEFMKEGMKSTPLSKGIAGTAACVSFLGYSGGSIGEGSYRSMPKFITHGYGAIWNNYFKVPYDPDRVVKQSDVVLPITDDNRFGWKCANLKNIWTTPLPPNSTEFNEFTGTVSGATATLDIMDLDRAYAELHTEQERDFFMGNRYRDVMEDGFGGHANIDADQRPELLKRTTFWASGYDVNGTDQSSLGQYSGRTMQSFQHKVPRKYIPEHGCVWTVVLCRFPVTHQNENHFLFNEQTKSLSYEIIAGDPVITAHSKPYTLSAQDIFNFASYTWETPHSQWYREHPDKVHGLYQEAQGFPFLDVLPKSLNDAKYVNSSDFDNMFATTQLGHFQIQARKNVTCIRRLPDVRSSIVTSD
jgi:hypothetical protein